MSCTNCNPCVEENNVDCSCPTKDMSTDCSTYTGDDLECSGIKKDTLLTKVIQDLDAFVCNIRTEVIGYLTLINVGTGAKLYRGISGDGKKEIRTLVSGDSTLLDVVEDTDTVSITAGTHSIEINSETEVLSLIVTTLAGSTVLSTINLSEYNYDTFVQSASFDSGTLDLTIARNNGEVDIVVPLDFLSNYVTAGVYSTEEIVLTLLDGSTVEIDLSSLVSELLSSAAQVQSDYLESDTNSKAYILNRNPSKTVVLGVAGNYPIVLADNNYIIEVDNGANDVTIDFSGIVLTTAFFVGIIQKGTGTVTINGVDIIPEQLTSVVFGQGHICAVEIINSTKYLIGTLKFA